MSDTPASTDPPTTPIASEPQHNELADDPQQDQPVTPETAPDNPPSPVPVSDPIVVEQDDNQYKEYMQREDRYINEFSDEYTRVEQWHTAFIAYLSARRDPILQQLKETNIKLLDGQTALQEAIDLIGLLIIQYTSQYEISLKKTYLYGQSLHSSPNHNPIITATGQTDASILALAALTQTVYNSNIDYNQSILTLKTHQQELTTQLKVHNFKHLFAKIKETEAAQDFAQEKLQQYYNTIREFGTQRSDIYALTSRKRQDIFLIRSRYVHALISLWNKHSALCDLVYTTTNEYLKDDKARAQLMFVTLTTISKELMALNTGLNEKLSDCLTRQNHAPTQAKLAYEELIRQQKGLPSNNQDNNSANLTQQHHIDLTAGPKGKTSIDPKALIAVNATLPSPVPAILTSRSTEKYFTTIPPNATHEDLEAIAKACPPPGEFPQDSTIVKQCHGKKFGTFSDKDCVLLYTKTHQLHLILQTTASPKPSAGNSTANARDHIPVYDDSEWILDAACVVARKSSKNDHMLIVRQPGFFFDSEKKVIMASATEVSEWVDFINSHNKHYAHVE